MRWILLAILLAPAVRADQAPPNMEKYYLVLLKRPANPPQLEPKTLEDLQKRHLEHLKSMYLAGKMAVAGPFDEQKDPTLRGLWPSRAAPPSRTRWSASGRRTCATPIPTGAGSAGSEGSSASCAAGRSARRRSRTPACSRGTCGCSGPSCSSSLPSRRCRSSGG